MNNPIKKRIQKINKSGKPRKNRVPLPYSKMLLILECVSRNPGLTMEELSALFDVSIDTLRHNVKLNELLFHAGYKRARTGRSINQL